MRPHSPEEQGDQHPAQAAVAVQERVQGLELRVQDGELHQPIGGLVVHVPLPCAHGLGKLLRPDGHEGRLLHGAAGRADPVGDAPVVAGGLALAAHPGEQHPVRLPDDPLADGQRLQHPLRLPHRGAVVEHLVDVGPALGGFRFPSRPRTPGPRPWWPGCPRCARRAPLPVSSWARAGRGGWEWRRAPRRSAPPPRPPGRSAG